MQCRSSLTLLPRQSTPFGGCAFGLGWELCPTKAHDDAGQVASGSEPGARGRGLGRGILGILGGDVAFRGSGEVVQSLHTNSDESLPQQASKIVSFWLLAAVCLQSALRHNLRRFLWSLPIMCHRVLKILLAIASKAGIDPKTLPTGAWYRTSNTLS